MKASRLIGVSESIGRRMEWKSSNGDMIRSDLCGCIRATDYKIPKNVWLEYDGNRTIHTDHTGDQLIKRFFDMAKQNTINLPPELEGKKFRIRKLTPRECFRLMGVDDADIDKMQAFPYHSLIEHPAYSKEERFRGMTEKEKRAAMKHSICDSAQYKLAGNSIVVDVLYHIFRKMLIETENESQQLTLF